MFACSYELVAAGCCMQVALHLCSSDLIVLNTDLSAFFTSPQLNRDVLHRHQLSWGKKQMLCLDICLMLNIVFEKLGSYESCWSSWNDMLWVCLVVNVRHEIFSQKRRCFYRPHPTFAWWLGNAMSLSFVFFKRTCRTSLFSKGMGQGPQATPYSAQTLT